MDSSVDSLMYQKNLITFDGSEVRLFNPFTGEPAHDVDDDPASDPANYFVSSADGRMVPWLSNPVPTAHVDEHE